MVITNVKCVIRVQCCVLLRGPTGGQREAVNENQKRLLKAQQRYTGRKRIKAEGIAFIKVHIH